MDPMALKLITKRALEDSASKEVKREIRMSELQHKYKSELTHSGSDLNEATWKIRTGVERSLVAPKPEDISKITSERLMENRINSASWENASFADRKTLLSKFVGITGQEMSLPHSLRNNLRVIVKEETQIDSIEDNKSTDIYVDKKSLENDNCIQAFGNVYYQMSILDCRSMTNGISIQENLEKINTPVLTEESFASAQTERFITDFNSVDLKSPELKKKIEAEKMSAEKIKQWPRIEKSKSEKLLLSECNPNYSQDVKWQKNCQRCVPTYEMRARGYDVTAEPRQLGDDHLAYYPFDVWKNPEVLTCNNNAEKKIAECMEKWGNGSRAQVVVQWKRGGGHTFVAEQINGKTYFIDPQTNDMDVSKYFKRVRPESVRFCRIDTLEPTTKIHDCCKGVEI